MPELPEVEMERRYAAAHALGRRIARVGKADPAVLERVTRASLHRALAGRCFTDTHRHGKWLFIRADAGVWLVLHFGMTGGLALVQPAEKDPRYVRFRVDFEDGVRLCLDDSRKSGWVGLTSDPQDVLAQRGWGPDPTHPGFDLAAFRACLQGRKGVLKSVLLNQQVIAGVGNLYADEMLFQAGLHPETRVADLRSETIEALYTAMMEAFTASLAAETEFEALPERFLLRYRNSTGECPKCRAALATLNIGGRTTAYCPRHQRRRH